jgi:hypothetical protein
VRKDQQAVSEKTPADMSRGDRLMAGWCPNCAEEGPHYVPPGGSTPGMWTCQRVPTLDERQAEAEQAES